MTARVFLQSSLALASLFAAMTSSYSANVEEAVSGERLFTQRCAMCHAAGGPGTLALSRRLGTERSLLAQRQDLQAEYVRAVVRAGQLTMPPLSRVEVTDAELGSIIEFLLRTQGKTSE